MKKQNIWTIILNLLVLILLCSCSSTPREKSEAEILEDISNQDTYIATYGLNITSHTVEKRQTNTEEKTDYVWVSVEAENEEFTYANSYEVRYVLYNEGWMLEDINASQGTYVATHPEVITKQHADACVSNNSSYEAYHLQDRQESENEITFFYTAERYGRYVKRVYDVSVTYRFSPETSWYTDGAVENGCDYVIDAIGEWKAEGEGKLGHESVSLNILDVDYANNQITFTYDFKDYTVISPMDGFKEAMSFSSDEPVTATMKRIDTYDEATGQRYLLYNDGMIEYDFVICSINDLREELRFLNEVKAGFVVDSLGNLVLVIHSSVYESTYEIKEKVNG